MKVPVVKIIPSSAVDGPGNRAVIFLSGCNFSCLYCHNPETIVLCRSCGKCIRACPSGALFLDGERVEWDSARCTGCLKCMKECPSHSTPRITYMDAEAAAMRIRSFMPFISGVTVSGGECTLYQEFLIELGRKVKELGLSFLVDTNGSIPISPLLVEIADGFMVDMKAFDSNEHMELTGKNNTVVLGNLQMLAARSKLEEVRTVLLPSLLSDRKTVHGVSELLERGSQKRVTYKLIRYRQVGSLSSFEEPAFDYASSIVEECSKLYTNVHFIIR